MWLYIFTCEHFDAAAKALRLRAFLADIFAFARGQTGQKPVKIGIIFIIPVKLLAAAGHATKFGSGLGFVCGAKGYMQRR